jgi:hypothetical protein
MNVAKRSVFLVLTSAFLAAVLCGCDRSGDTAGEKLDHAIDKTGDAVKDAGDAIKTR